MQCHGNRERRDPSEIIRSIGLEYLYSKQCSMTLALSRITDKLELDGMCSQVGTFFFSFFFFFHEEEKSLRERNEISRTFPFQCLGSFLRK